MMVAALSNFICSLYFYYFLFAAPSSPHESPLVTFCRHLTDRHRADLAGAHRSYGLGHAAAPGGRDCPPRHLSDAPRELGLVAVSRHLKYSALCATVVSRDFNPTSTPSPRHTPWTRRPLPAGEDDALGPLLGPLCCSSELRRLGDAAVAHVRPDRSIGGCSAAAPAPLVFSKGPLPHQHAIDATHFEARLAAASRRSIPLDAVEGKAVGWAVLLVSTSVEVCGAREQANGPESHRSHRQACRALC